MKTCTKCKLKKPVGQFPGHPRTRDKLGSHCKLCVNVYVANWRRNKRMRLNALKKGPCVNCGGQFPPEAMDFDHVKGRKKFALSKARDSKLAWDMLLNEITKCDLVCANCHRIRTRKRI